jgi:uroporphyrinogen III methyltransferase/synthase
VKNIKNYTMLVLTSINGAEILFKKLKELKCDIRKLSHLKFAAIGSGTAKVLEQYGIFPELLPKVYTSACLGELIAENAGDRENVLILRAEKGSPELTEILDNNHIKYDDIKTYDVVNESLCPSEVNTDFITFGSSSGVNSFFKGGYSISKNTKVVCIGDITAKSLKKYGVENYIVSKVSDVEGIAAAIIKEVKKWKD